MKRLFLLILLCMTGKTAHSQQITQTYDDVPLSDVLLHLNDQQDEYTIMFIYNELESYHISTSVVRKSIPDALEQIIGFYPIRIQIDSSDPSDKKIFVEPLCKTDRHLTGIVHDEQEEAVAFANIALLSPSDSTVLAGGVSNASGYFSIPFGASVVCDTVLVRCSYVGYKTVYRLCSAGDIGIISLEPAEYLIKGVKVNGTHIMNHVDKTVHTFTDEQVRSSRHAHDLLEKVEDLRTNPVSRKLERMDGGNVLILLNGVRSSDIDLKGIPSEKVVRVEYYNIPPARYADAGTVLNVITRKLDTGVGGGIDAQSAFTTGFSDEEAYLNMISGNHQLSFSYGFSLRDYDKRISNRQYDYILDGEASHYRSVIRDKFGYTVNTPTLKYTYSKDDDVTFQVVAQPNFDRDHSNGVGDIRISTEKSVTDGTASLMKRAKSFGPVLNAYLQKSLPHDQELEVDLVGTYYHNKVSSSNEQSSLDDGGVLLSDAVRQINDKYSFIGEISYGKNWESGSRLNLGYRGSFGRSQATISNVLSNYNDYDYTSASYQNYLYAEYSGKLKRLMYRIGTGATYVSHKNDDTHDSRWYFTPKLVLSYNVSQQLGLQFVTSSGTNVPSISLLSNNAQMVIPGVMSVGNPYLRSSNIYQTQFVCRWNLGWLTTRLTLDYRYADRPYSQYFTQQEMMGRQYVVRKSENARFSSDFGGSYQFTFSPFKSKELSVMLQGYVYRQTISSPVVGRYHHVWAPLYFGVQYQKGCWGAMYQGSVVSKRLNGPVLDAGENASHLQVYWQKKGLRIYAADYWLFTRSRYSGYSLPTSILQTSYKTHIDDNRSMFVIGFSYNFSTGKKLNINRKLHNRDNDKGTF